MTREIIRFFEDGTRLTIQRGATLEEARDHCEDPETSSATCTEATGLERTRLHGRWFDGHEEE